jgi:hypothetical protein
MTDSLSVYNGAENSTSSRLQNTWQHKDLQDKRLWKKNIFFGKMYLDAGS